LKPVFIYKMPYLRRHLKQNAYCMNIFVGSLPFKLSDSELRELFEKYGEVSSAKIINDRETGRSKGFGFVEMPDDEQAQKAIEELNGSDLKGRSIVVNQSEERKRDGGGNRGGGGGYSGGGSNRGGGGYGGGSRGGDSGGYNRY
jgi:RNA recognition motif-containing protein